MKDIKLAATRKEFTLQDDESGYRFDIVATLDQETGWSAHMTLATYGFKTDEAALEHLVPAAEHFVHLMREK